MHKNLINNKVYIGQTKSADPNKRWRNGTHYENTYFGRAIQKYGWDNFEHIILESEIPTQEEANQKEQEYIALYNSTNKDFGYNSTTGGMSFELSEEVRQQRREIMRKRWQNEDFKQSMKEKLHQYWETHPEIKAERGQTIRCIETNQIFQSYKEAGDWCGLVNYKCSLLSYFRGERQSCGKHSETGQPLHWIKIDKQGNEFLNNQNFDLSKSKKGRASRKQVQCINNGMIFNSLVEAASWCGLKNSSSITNMIKGRKKSAGKILKLAKNYIGN
jgi:group I intron endonuclease